MNENDYLTPDFDESTLPSKTWNIDFENNMVTTNIDDLEAIRQSAILILSTERYEYPIFSFDYGTELLDLFGENQQYVMSEVKRRISEALLQDDRIASVDNFEYTRNGRKLEVTFTVITAVGQFNEETGVEL